MTQSEKIRGIFNKQLKPNKYINLKQIYMSQKMKKSSWHSF